MKKLLTALSPLFALGVFSLSPALADPAVTFQVTDDGGSWFVCSKTGSTTSIGCVADPNLVAGMGEKSLVVVSPGDTIAFASLGQANTLHTAVSLLFPHKAKNMPFDVDLVPPLLGGSGTPFTVTVKDPGLYVFFCDIHPYMFATVIVDDPATQQLDLGKTVDLPRVTPGGISGLPTAADLVLRLVHTFFIVTNPNNWQNFPASGTSLWKPSYPAVPVLAFDANGNPVPVPNLNDFLHSYFLETNDKGEFIKTLSAPVPPSIPGNGQVWVDTQFEKVSQKIKPGTATAVDATLAVAIVGGATGWRPVGMAGALGFELLHTVIRPSVGAVPFFPYSA